MTDASVPVLVGIDGSDNSIRALHWAVRYARAVQAPLRVVGVLDEHLAESDAADEVRDSLLAEARQLLADDGAVSYEVESFVGKPAEHLTELSRDARLVVMGSRGHSTISDLVIGSVSQHVARQASCPVAVIREPSSEDANRVVIGTDGSMESVPALEWGFAFAAATGAEVSVVYGFVTSAASPAVLAGYIPINVSDEISAAEQMLADVVAPIAARFPDVEVRQEAITVPPSVALVDESADASLVVVGSRGRGAFEGMLLGSVSQRLLHRAECSVAVVR